MPITIHAPQLPATLSLSLLPHDSDHAPDSDGDGDVPMSGTPAAAHASTISIVTPGETVTSDPQWMRGHGTYLSPTLSIIATLAGTVQKTNKLLSVRALHTRYTPEIGDLVVGRIAEVQSKRWKVDINSVQHAALLLSSINLPGGILRKRTSTDELQIRTFFAERDLLVAEVQSLFADGSASLHTRSLRYGKLRNGYLVAVAPAGVRRGRSQVVGVAAANGAGELEVVVGVNGYVWIAKKVVLERATEGKGGESITRLEEEASEAIYSSKNEVISAATRREIARVGCCVKAMVRHHVKVDEEMLNAVYEAAVEAQEEAEARGEGGVEGDGMLEGETGRRVVEKALARKMGT